MIAFEAVIDDPTAARPDGEESVEVRWYSRAQMRNAMESAPRHDESAEIRR